jgi:prepilin-type N-terminal cleavage/methylation domain-containing protein
MKRQTERITRSGFTLVELLIVIAIIGILAGLTVTAVSVASKTIQGRAIALEVEALEQAVEAYKTKYQNYPPDGSSRTAFESHFRSVYPQILASEFTDLYSVANSNSPTGVMDPAEALVFCLGGLSKSPTKPFTGPGGPLAAIPGGGFQYNVDRNEPLFPGFEVERLTLDTSTGVTISNDEITLGVLNGAGSPIGANDVLPVYIPKNRAVPFVYFSSATYRVDSSANNYFNRYAGPFGIARPYKSDQVNTKIALTTTLIPQRDRYYMYMNDKSFQIISAGLDDDFGGSSTLFFRFKSGTPLDIALAPGAQPAGANYAEEAGSTAGQISQLDNVTNFSEGTLADALP